ncbi:transglutaminase domain-containing protein [Sarcina sp. JB2]|uniref:Transglutaminase domain-containing protein n=1 Tax=Candidatus Sarcina troglodytae TaxID=2726954 RepID=A0ACD1BCC8_9CLOT|nr:transglutaminase-like domain-containing protein [Sarcina sp. JB2]QPJ85065.1 transglutaminase domain-containing protein [Sarcina sp. JB2]
MNFNIVSIILVLIFVIPIFLGFIKGFNYRSGKYELFNLEKDIVVLVTIVLGAINSNIILNILNYIKSNIVFLNNLNGLAYRIYYIIGFIILLIILYNIIMLFIRLINLIIFDPLLKLIDRLGQSLGTGFTRICGVIFAIPNSIINIIIAAFIIKALLLLPLPTYIINQIDNSNIYNYLNTNIVEQITDSSLVKNFPKLLNNSLKIENGNNGELSDNNSNGAITYYNGVTLAQAVKSSPAIDAKTQEIIAGKRTDEAKAYAIYQWVGQNITYDNKKAQELEEGDVNLKSGAIAAFDTREGVCFDYASLYVAMARDAGLKVRLITGEGFDGTQWVSHAWNQVYIPSQNKWINVDCTFYDAGNFFNSSDFNEYHKDASIAGQWG